MRARAEERTHPRVPRPRADHRRAAARAAGPCAATARRAPQAPAGARVRPAHGHAAAAARGSRRCSRSTSPALFLAIFTALCLKAWALGALDRAASRRADPDRRTSSRSPPSSRALLFARSGLYAGARAAAGPDAHRRRAVPDDGRRAALRARQRPGLPELLHLLRLAVLRRRVRRPVPLRLRVDRPGGAAGRRLPAPRRARRHRRAHRRRRPRAHPRRRLAREHHGLRLAHRAPGQRPLVARLGRRHRRHRRRPQDRRGHHRRPGLPRAGGDRARRPVPPARGHGARSRRRRWRSSSTARSSSRASRCRCSSCARRCSRASTTCSSARSTSSARR